MVEKREIIIEKRQKVIENKEKLEKTVYRKKSENDGKQRKSRENSV